MSFIHSDQKKQAHALKLHLQGQQNRITHKLFLLDY